MFTGFNQRKIGLGQVTVYYIIQSIRYAPTFHPKSIKYPTISQNYKEIRKIGEGAFSQVYLCIHKPIKQKRAIKNIQKSGLHKEQI